MTFPIYGKKNPNHQPGKKRQFGKPTLRSQVTNLKNVHFVKIAEKKAEQIL